MLSMVSRSQSLELFDDALPQLGSATGPADAHTPGLEGCQLALQHLGRETHDERNFAGRALPVFGARRRGGHVRDAHFDGARDDIQQGGLAGAVTFGEGRPQSLAQRPLPSGDDGDVLGMNFFGIGGRAAPVGCAGGVRAGCVPCVPFFPGGFSPGSFA